MNEDFLQRLLALHYVYPKPLNKFHILLENDPELTGMERMPLELLAVRLNISIDTAAQLRSSFNQALKTPYLPLYEKHHIIPIHFLHPSYPESLKDLIDPPAVLYAKGRAELLENRERIAVIGSRKATSYSRKAINAIIPELIEQQMVIVSGLAKGADTMAHRAAIDAGGDTIAVTGSGFLHPYPKENKELFIIIEEKGLLITEYPPYMTPRKWNFPMRNRIISGISNGILVTEAKLKSGTLSTIDHGLDHGKEIFAVPGDIFSPLSEGPHKLILEGAKPVWKGAQVLEEYRQLKAEITPLK